jgi:hypothetical protein
MVMFNPSGVDEVVGFVSVGFTYGYSRGGPLRGHNHLTFYTPNFCVAHPAQRPNKTHPYKTVVNHVPVQVK